jgi:thiol-disulfide isomerase/thioredoxin
MNYRNLRLSVLALLASFMMSAQLKVSEHIKPSSIALNPSHKLYFVDFWATWCGPCLAVSKYLTGLQRQFPEDFYVLSLTQENPDIVKRFMSKHNSGLAVAIDYNGDAFSNYHVASLPYGILLNAAGDKLWEGHPAELKTNHVKSFLKREESRATIDEMFLLQHYEPVVLETPDYDFKRGIEVEALPNFTGALTAVKKKSHVEVTGLLRDILAYTHNVYKDQLKMDPILNKAYRIRFEYNTKAYEHKTKAVLKYLKLKENNKKEEGELLFFDLTTSKFWDVNQINWGDDTPNFLIGETDIKADDVSLQELAYKLSNLLEIPIVTNDKNLLNEQHDWDVHYKYFDLMTAALEDTYGIKVEKKVGSYYTYTIRE